MYYSVWRKHLLDKSTRTIFGDAVAATLVAIGDSEILEFDLGTDDSGYDKLIVLAGGAVLQKSKSTSEEYEDNGYIRTKNNLFMDGTEIFNFTIRVVPDIITMSWRKTI